MVMVFLIVGVAYVYYVDNQTPLPKATQTAKNPVEQEVIKPVQPSANAPEGVAVETLLSPVKAGENTSISVRSNAGSSCTIVVSYDGGRVSKDSGLLPKPADVYGFTTWTWTVEPNVPAGTYPIKVTCVYNGRTGLVIGNLEVTK